MSEQNWLSRIGGTTGRDYGYTFQRFMEWKSENGGKFAGMSPDEMIEYQRSRENGDQYEMLDLVQRWVLSMGGRAYKTKHTYYVTLLSFFTHNRAALPKDKSFKVRGDKPRTPSNLRPEHVKEAVLAANPMYGAIITCMIGGGMGISELLEWSNTGWKSLRAQLNEGAGVVKVDLPGRKSEKNIRPYFTLIGGDALRLLIHYLGPDLPEKRKAIFINPLGEPVNETALKRWWLRHLIRLGIVEKEEDGARGTRYGYGLHELRDNFRTLWSQSRANPDVGEFLMGHKLDEYEYNHVYRDFDYVVGEYSQALPLLNVLSGGFDPERDEEVNTLQDKVRELEEKLAETTRNDDLQQQLEKQQRLIEEMMPAFKVAQRMLEESAEWKKLRDAPQ